MYQQGKHIVPTETGLSLFGVLKQADPALVDPGVTAQLECLLDDVVVGKQEMVSAIDAVCDVAQRIYWQALGRRHSWRTCVAWRVSRQRCQRRRSRSSGEAIADVVALVFGKITPSHNCPIARRRLGLVLRLS